MRFADSDSDETATSTSDTTESSAGGPTDRELNDADHKEDRFRVDRRKLEQMLQGETLVSNGQTAEDFFHRIMEETNTQISWPSKLKVGAKSKKDPHIKIIGDPDNVTSAREMVLEILDTKRNRVTLKMDVSFTDHSHIIGKGGHSIQQVMEDTGCHIHFPDSNRNSMGEKSNQVSIAGLPAGVEKARCRIRELLPMVLTFDIPLTAGFLQPVTDVTNPAIQLIQQRHGITVTFRPKQRTTSVVVRGSRRIFPQMRQGVLTLMEYLTGNSGTVLPVTLSMEITPQHHTFVMGRGSSNVSAISRETGATVNFPDPTLVSNFPSANPIHVPQQTNIAPRRSTVVITGHIDGVCAAWQELMGCLPLVLMFDLKEGQELDTAQVTRLMDQLNINIVIRPKPKQNTKCLLVRGAERDSRLLFEVRRQLLGVDPADEPLPVCCEKHSDTANNNNNNNNNIPPVPSMTFNNGHSKFDGNNDTANESSYNHNVMNSFTNGYQSHHNHHHQQQLNSQMLQQTLPPMTNNSDLGHVVGGGQGNYPLLPWLLNQLSGTPSSVYNAILQARMTDLALASLLSQSMKNFNVTTPYSDQASGSSQTSSLSSPSESPCESPVFMTCSSAPASASHSSSSSVDSLTGDKDFSSTKSWNNPFWLSNTEVQTTSNEAYSDYSDYSTLSSGSCDSLHIPRTPCPPIGVQPLAPIHQNAVFQSIQVQGRPIVAASANSSSKDDLLASVMESGGKSVGSVGCERKSRESSSLADYNAKKLQAVQAIQKNASGARIPTDVWSGYGFSKTLPEDLLRNRLQESRVLSQRVDTIPEQLDSSGSLQHTWYNQPSIVSVEESFVEKKRDFATSLDSGVGQFSCSNYFDNNLLPRDLSKEIKDLTYLLSLLDLDKYCEVFQQQQVDLPTFLTLSDRDLQELSIPFFARRKMLRAISELNLQGENSLSRPQQFQPAPGAERRAMFSRQSAHNYSPTTGSEW